MVSKHWKHTEQCDTYFWTLIKGTCCRNATHLSISKTLCKLKTMSIGLSPPPLLHFMILINKIVLSLALCLKVS